MLISICIPHHNRVRYLLAVLESIVRQDYSNIEVIVSDDCSTDDSSTVVPAYVSTQCKVSDIKIQYLRQTRNIGYDANLRASMAAAKGEYLFLLGNDDALATSGTISSLTATLRRLNFPDIAFTNSHTYGMPAQVARRARSTRLIGAGPDIATKVFRSFSFFGGVVIKRTAFAEHNTVAFDGTVYVQMYLGARTIASGGRVASIEEPMVAKDVIVDGEAANSYRDVLARNNTKIEPKTGGLDQVGRLACHAILPFVPKEHRWWYATRIYAQLLAFTYPYWLYAYRNDGVYKAALNMALGCFPTRLIVARNTPGIVYAVTLPIYILATFAGLCAPTGFLKLARRYMLRFSKSF